MIKKTTLQLLFILLLPLIGFTQPTEFVVLDGSQNIDIPDSDYLNEMDVTNRTIEFWFRVDNVDNTTRQILYKERASTRGLNVWVESGKIYLGMFNPNSADVVDNRWLGTWFRKDIESHRWYHVALVLDNGTSSNPIGTDELKWYINGELQAEAHGGKLFSDGGNMYIGRNSGSLFALISSLWVSDANGGEYFTPTTATGNIPDGTEYKTSAYRPTGAIGNFRIWNSARSQTQINDNKKIKLTTLNTAPENMVAYLEGNIVKYITDTGTTADTSPGGTAFPQYNASPNDFEWNGATSTSWSDGSNWLGSTAPDPAAGENIVINVTGYDPDVPSVLTVGNLTISNGIFQVNTTSSSVQVNGNLSIEADGYIVFNGKITSSLNVKGTADNKGYINFLDTDSSQLIVTGVFTNEGIVSFSSSIDSEFRVKSKFTNKAGAEVHFKKGTSNILPKNSGFTVEGGGLDNFGLIDFTYADNCGFEITGDLLNEVLTGSILFTGVRNNTELRVYGNVTNNGVISFDPVDNNVSSGSGFTINPDKNILGLKLTNNGAITFSRTESCGFEVNGDVINNPGAKIEFNEARKLNADPSEFRVLGDVTNKGLIDFKKSWSSSFHVDGNMENVKGSIIKFEETKYIDGPSEFTVSQKFDNYGLVTFFNSENSGFTVNGDFTNDVADGVPETDGAVIFKNTKYCGFQVDGLLTNKKGSKIRFNGSYTYDASVKPSELRALGGMKNYGLVSFGTYNDGTNEIPSKNSGFKVTGDLINEFTAGGTLGVDGLISFISSESCGFHVTGKVTNKKGAIIKFEDAKLNAATSGASAFTVSETFENYGLVTFLNAEESGFTVTGTFKNDVVDGVAETDGAVIFQNTKSCGFQVNGLLTNNKGSKIRFNGASVTGTQSELRALGGITNHGLVSFGTYNDGTNEIPSKNSGFKVENGDLLNEFPTGGTVGVDGLISFISSESCGFHVDGNATNKLGSIIKFEKAEKVGSDPSEFTVTGNLQNFGEIKFSETIGSGFSVDGTLFNQGDNNYLLNGLISFDSSEKSGIIANGGIQNVQTGVISFVGAKGYPNTPGEASEIRVTAGDIINDGKIDFTGSINSGIDVQVGNLDNQSTLILGPQSYATIKGNLNNSTSSSLFQILSYPIGTGTLKTEGTVTNSGKFEIQRYLKEDGSNNGYWQLVSSPMDGEKSESFYGHFLNWYDQPNGDFNAYSSRTENLVVGQGYVSKLEYEFGDSKGNPLLFDQSKPNTGDNISFPISNNGAGESYFALPGNFNLVGNPYPSNLDWDEVSSDNGNIATKYYYYVDGASSTPDGIKSGWTTYTVNDGGDYRYISTGQSFGVECSTSGNIVFNNDQRVHNYEGGTFGKKSNDNGFIELMSKSHGFVDVSKIRFNENTTADYDFNIDTYKLNSFEDNAPNVSFVSDDGFNQYVCEMPETESVDLGFVMHSDGEVIFSLKNTEGYKEIILEDTQEKTFTDLKKSDYPFSYSSDEVETGRFTLRFVKSTLNEVESNIGMKVYYGSNSLNIESSKNLTDAFVNIYNINGQVVLKREFASLNNVVIDTNLPKGIYMVEVVSNEHKEIVKISLTNNL